MGSSSSTESQRRRRRFSETPRAVISWPLSREERERVHKEDFPEIPLELNQVIYGAFKEYYTHFFARGWRREILVSVTGKAALQDPGSVDSIIMVLSRVPHPVSMSEDPLGNVRIFFGLLVPRRRYERNDERSKGARKVFDFLFPAELTSETSSVSSLSLSPLLRSSMSSLFPPWIPMNDVESGAPAVQNDTIVSFPAEPGPRLRRSTISWAENREGRYSIVYSANGSLEQFAMYSEI